MCLDNTDKGREAFSKVKSLLGQAGARTREALIEAMGRALDTVTTKDIRGFSSIADTRFRPNLYDNRCRRAAMSDTNRNVEVQR